MQLLNVKYWSSVLMQMCFGPAVQIRLLKKLLISWIRIRSVGERLKVVFLQVLDKVWGKLRFSPALFRSSKPADLDRKCWCVSSPPPSAACTGLVNLVAVAGRQEVWADNAALAIPRISKIWSAKCCKWKRSVSPFIWVQLSQHYLI